MIAVKLHEPLQAAIENAIKFSALTNEDTLTLENALSLKCVSPSALKVLKNNLSSSKRDDLLGILQGSKLLFPHTNIKKEEQVGIV